MMHYLHVQSKYFINSSTLKNLENGEFQWLLIKAVFFAQFVPLKWSNLLLTLSFADYQNDSGMYVLSSLQPMVTFVARHLTFFMPTC